LSLYVLSSAYIVQAFATKSTEDYFLCEYCIHLPPRSENPTLQSKNTTLGTETIFLLPFKQYWVCCWNDHQCFFKETFHCRHGYILWRVLKTLGCQCERNCRHLSIVHMHVRPAQVAELVPIVIKGVVYTNA